MKKYITSFSILAFAAFTLVVLSVPRQTYADASLSVTAQPTAIASGGTFTLNFVVPTKATSAKLYLVCPAGVAVARVNVVDASMTGATSSVCNTAVTVGISPLSSMTFYVSNSTSQVQNIVPNFYIYTTDSPSYSQGVSANVSVQPRTTVNPNPTYTPYVTPTVTPTPTPSSTVCPTGYICTPITQVPNCPAGYICTPISQNNTTVSTPPTPPVLTIMPAQYTQNTAVTYPGFDIDVSTLSGLSKTAAITRMYEALQHREPEAAGLSYWVSVNADYASIKQQMVTGFEYSTKHQIVLIFNSQLGRNPTDQELNNWYSAAYYHSLNLDVVRTGLKNGTDPMTLIPAQYQTTPTPTPSYSPTPTPTPTASAPLTSVYIDQLYVTYLHRHAEPAGMSYWLNSGLTSVQLVNLFQNSPEYFAKQKINGIFNSVLNRLPTDQELGNWYTTLTQNGYNYDAVRQGLQASPTQTPAASTQIPSNI